MTAISTLEQDSSTRLASTAASWVTLLLLMLWQAGCASTAERVAEGAAEGAAPAGLEASLAALQEEETQEHLAEVINLVTREILEASLATLGRETEKLSEAMQNMAQTAAADVMDEVLNDQRKEEALDFAEALTRRVAETLVQTSAEGLRRELGPAMEQMIKQHLAPAHREMATQEVYGRVETMAEPAVQDLVADVSRSAARAQAMGLQDATIERNVLLVLGLGAFGLMLVLLVGIALIVWIAVRMRPRREPVLVEERAER